MFEEGPCMASWNVANKSQKEKQGITLGETFEDERRSKESFKDVINNDVLKENQ